MGQSNQLRVKVVQKLARKKVVGGHNRQVDTIRNWFVTDEQGRVEDVIRDLVRDPDAPLEAYGGSRDAVRLTSIAAAKEYIEAEGGELPWGLRDE